MASVSRHAVRTHRHITPAAPEAVFPLLCPTREYDWIPHWSCDLLNSASGLAELDCAFATNFPGLGREIWVQTRHEPDRAVEFVRIGEGRAMRYTIELLPVPGGTALCLTQRTTYTDDDAAIKCTADDAKFTPGMIELMRLLDHYLTHGEALRPNGAQH